MGIWQGLHASTAWFARQEFRRLLGVTCGRLRDAARIRNHLRGGPMGRPVVHFEIGCRNLKNAQEFYSQMFDWKPQSMGPAAMIAAETGGIGGHMTSLGHEPHHYTIFYVDVDDVAAYLKKAESLGGKTLVPPVKIPNRHLRLDARSRRQHCRPVE